MLQAERVPLYARVPLYVRSQKFPSLILICVSTTKYFDEGVAIVLGTARRLI